MNVFIKKLQDAGTSALSFGRQNAPSLMTGGGILIGWVAAYVFWRQGRKAEEKIRAEEEKLNEDNESDAPEDQVKLPKKEKAAIYLQYCWTALALGIASSGLTVWAHKIDLMRLTEMVMVTKLLGKQNEDQEKLIEKMKEELGPKKAEKTIDKLLKEEYPDEELKKDAMTAPGNGRTLFKDLTRFDYKFKSNIENVKDGIYRFNQMMTKRWEKALRKELGGPFFVSENSVYPDTPIYVEGTWNDFLECIGEPANDGGIGENMVFIYNGSGMCVDPDDIMRYREFEDPDTGVAQFCYLDYFKYLKPSETLQNRRI